MEEESEDSNLFTVTSCMVIFILLLVFFNEKMECICEWLLSFLKHIII